MYSKFLAIKALDLIKLKCASRQLNGAWFNWVTPSAQSSFKAVLAADPTSLLKPSFAKRPESGEAWGELPEILEAELTWRMMRR